MIKYFHKKVNVLSKFTRLMIVKYKFRTQIIWFFFECFLYYKFHISNLWGYSPICCFFFFFSWKITIVLGLPVARTPHSQCRGSRFSPGQGTRSTCCNCDPEQPKKKKKNATVLSLSQTPGTSADKVFLSI